ncbi:MAG TPA: Ig-like domain-containing protein, partial [Candidatus Acidoferrum sp.]|nr:Ig-like domain-containing protein [Candidatus Acidoferrum sp.]
MLISLRRNSSAIRTCIVRLSALLLLLLLGGVFGQAEAAGITLVQHVAKDAGTTTTSTLAFASANTSGSFIAVAIRGGLSNSQVFTVTDSNGNTYKKAAQVGFTVSAVTGAVYYAENIKGGANTVTVSMTVSGPLRFAILEYSGVATANSLDVIATATGVGTAVSSGNATTTVSGDLLFGTVSTADAATWTAGTSYTIRDQIPSPPNAKFITEDQIQAAAGTAAATATLAASGNWGVVFAAFKPAGGVAGTPATIAATAGTPQSATVGGAFGTQLQATVKDSFNNPVSGATVAFAAPGSGASGTFAGGVTTATTNASGVATSAVFTANSTAGSYTVMATVSGVA